MAQFATVFTGYPVRSTVCVGHNESSYSVGSLIALFHDLLVMFFLLNHAKNLFEGRKRFQGKNLRPYIGIEVII